MISNSALPYKPGEAFHSETTGCLVGRRAPALSPPPVSGSRSRQQAAGDGEAPIPGPHHHTISRPLADGKHGRGQQ